MRKFEVNEIPDESNAIEVVKRYYESSYHPYIGNRIWKYATPLTKEDLYNEGEE